VGPSNVHSLDHCTLWLTNPEIARWKSIAAKPSAPYYHFFVNGCMQQLPVLNGSEFFTQWLVVIDLNVDDFCPRFEVAGVFSQPIVEQTDPRLRSGCYANFTFLFKYDSLAPQTPAQKVQTTSISVTFLSILFLIPTSILFYVNKPKFVSVCQLIDTKTLPLDIDNLQFFASAAVCELLHLFILCVLTLRMGISIVLFLNILIFIAGPVAYLRVWLSRVAGNYLSTTDFTAYIFVPAGMGATMPFVLTYAESWLFGSFKGFPWWTVAIFATVYLGAANVAADSFGIFAYSMIEPPRTPCWFHKPGPDTKYHLFSIPWFIAYGIGGAALLCPVAQHVLDWGFGEVTCDLNFITTSAILCLSYASFCGLYRTIHRLKTGRGNWHDDHVVAQLFILPWLLFFILYYVFVVKGLLVLDIVGIAAVAVQAFAVLTGALVFGTGGSYLVSFVFVYFAVIKPHTEDTAPGFIEPRHQ
jgi:hypothetical protein